MNKYLLFWDGVGEPWHSESVCLFTPTAVHENRQQTTRKVSDHHGIDIEL